MNILVVDDDMALLRSLEILLGAQNHHVMGISDPETACRYMAQHPDIDVLLVDYVMRTMNGEEMLQQMRGSIPEYCRTYMVTGHREAIPSFKVLQALGVRQILSKPLDFSEVCELVDQT